MHMINSHIICVTKKFVSPVKSVVSNLKSLCLVGTGLPERHTTPCLESTIRTFSTSSPQFKRLPSVNDVKDVGKMVKNELLDGRVQNILPCPRECDVLIIGGSVIGSSIAYFLKEQSNNLNVVVIEPDSTYAKASALLSAGGMRQQFTCQENIEMSQFGFEFFRRMDRLLAVDNVIPPDINFNHAGYLILAGADQAQEMTLNHELQLKSGAVNILLSKSMLREKFPWINTDGIEIASLGVQGEGWFDPAAFLAALRGKARALGVTYVTGKLTGFEKREVLLQPGVERSVLDMGLVELPNGDVQPIKAPIFVNAAGAWSGEIARMAGIGDEGIGLDCAVPLPVEPRKRFVYYYHSPEGPGLDCSLVTDITQGGVYFRREGLCNNYICGLSPTEELEHDHSNLDDIDYDFFDEHIWPKLAHRVPAFENLKIKSAWAGYYDYNYVDHNLIIGPHPHFNNFVFANGSTGHGLQHSPAIGRAISELIHYSKFRTVDLSRFSFNRFLEDADLSTKSEKNIY